MTESPLASAARQLSDELGGRHRAIVTLIGRDEATDFAAQRIAPAAARLAAQMEQTDDDRVAAGTAVDVMCALWPDANPEDCDRGDWWATPLGRLVARAGDWPGSEAVTYSSAAAMLGVHRGTVSQMVTRGTLDRHPDGGVLRASVMQRLGR